MTTDSSATIPLRILIADDNQSDRMILKAILTRHGHEVIMAEDGVQAVAAFEQQRPQMVLLDVLMPNMDGLEAARLIKAAAGEDLVPIIFLTSLSDAESLASCLEVGGDDFLTKPYNRVILRAKIHAFQRMRDLHQSLQDERDRTDQRNRQMMREQALARRVFDNIAGRGCLEADNVRFEASPMSIFNGDVLFASPKPSGGMHLFVGDFTGHGLPAAIGALPMSEIFYGMTAKGFAISDILREMNRKLQNILPTGFFCCAAMIDLNLRSGDAEVWNGGLPTAWILRHDGTHDELPSRHLPLGILSGERFSAACERHKLALGEHMLLATDGVIESSNGEGEMFGEERAVAAIGQRRAPDEGFDCLRDAAHWFGEGVVSEDDITILDVAMVQESALGALEHEVLPDTGTGPEQWRLQYDLRDRSLAEFNPVPLLLHVCMDVPGLRLFSGDVYTVITELFSNALEHGVLRLPSGLKDSPSGFSRYYSERERLLGQLDSGWVSITLEHQAHGDDGGGTLLVTVADSGPGFEFREGASSLNHEQLSGRGIALVQALCHDVRWSQNGNCVEAKYTWRSG